LLLYRPFEILNESHIHGIKIRCSLYIDSDTVGEFRGEGLPQSPIFLSGIPVIPSNITNGAILKILK
jgi:hypothetical protein